MKELSENELAKGEPQKFDALKEATKAHAEAEKLRAAFSSEFEKLPPFEKLPVIQQLQARWEEKGLHPSDPVFLLIEVLGVFDVRQRYTAAHLGKTIGMSEKVTLALVHEMRSLLESTNVTGNNLETLQNTIESVLGNMHEVVIINKKFIEVLPKTHESIYQAVRLINERGIWVTIVNWLTPMIAFATGVVAVLLTKSFVK